MVDTSTQKSSGNVAEIKTKEGAVQARPSRALSPFEEMERMMEGMFPRNWLRLWPRSLGEWPTLPETQPPFEGRWPKVDVIDRDNEVVVRAELPGVSKDDIDISLSENTLTLRASTRRETKEEKGNYHRCEITRGEFARTLSLPADVDAEQARTSFKDGLLELTLPKVQPAKRRTIKVE